MVGNKTAEVAATSDAVAKSYNIDDNITSNPYTAPQTDKKSKEIQKRGDIYPNKKYSKLLII